MGIMSVCVCVCSLSWLNGLLNAVLNAVGLAGWLVCAVLGAVLVNWLFVLC